MAEQIDGLHTRLTAENLDQYFRAGTPATIRVLDAPDCLLVIDGTAQDLSLWVPAIDRGPDVDQFARLDASDTELPDGRYHVLTAHVFQGDHFECYSLLASIVDDLARGFSLPAAVDNSVATFKDLLAGRGRLSKEKTVGLIGELLVLEHLIGRLGTDDAMAAWVGPQSEEHDIVLPAGDFEIKTTSTEDRRHVIGSSTQLARTGDRPLWLVSIQLTNGGRASEAMALPDVVDRVRSAFVEPRLFDRALAEAGYAESARSLYREKYLVRTTPRAYRVDESFPAITRSQLEQLLPRPELVSFVSYRVDVTPLPFEQPVGPLADFVERP